MDAVDGFAGWDGDGMAMAMKLCLVLCPFVSARIGWSRPLVTVSLDGFFLLVLD